MAFQCPKLIKKIEDEIAIRFDPASQDAKEKAALATEACTPRATTPSRRRSPRTG